MWSFLGEVLGNAFRAALTDEVTSAISRKTDDLAQAIGERLQRPKAPRAASPRPPRKKSTKKKKKSVQRNRSKGNQ